MEVFHDNVRRLSAGGGAFRRVLATNAHLQLVTVSLEPQEDSGEEAHVVAQVFLVMGGAGVMVLDGERRPILTGDVVVVPAGMRHNLVNTGRWRLEVLAVYGPPQYRADTLQPFRSDAAHPSVVRV